MKKGDRYRWKAFSFTIINVICTRPILILVSPIFYPSNISNFKLSIILYPYYVIIYNKSAGNKFNLDYFFSTASKLVQTRPLSLSLLAKTDDIEFV